MSSDRRLRIALTERTVLIADTSIRTESIPFWGTIFICRVAAAEIRYNAGIVYPPARPPTPVVLFREEQADNRRVVWPLLCYATQRRNRTCTSWIPSGCSKVIELRKTARETRCTFVVRRIRHTDDTFPRCLEIFMQPFQ